MLKFLDNRKGQIPYRSPKKFQPDLAYGISCQAPPEFQHPHTIIWRKSYANPYLNMQPERRRIVDEAKGSVQKLVPATKINPIYQEDHRTLGNRRQSEDVNDKFRMSYRQALNHSPSVFRKTKGPFLDFVERNHRYQSVGPLIGKERSNESMRETRTRLYQKSRQSLFQRTKKSQATQYSIDQIRDLLHSQSSIGRNSHLFAETTKIRDNRNRFNSEVRQLLEQRKTSDRFAITASYFPSISLMQRQKKLKQLSKKEEMQSIEQQQRDYEEYARKLQRRIRF